jgi:UDP-glucose 4-epimerase
MLRFMRALVTGGAGFIGSNLVDALLARGDDVTVLDNVSTGRRENLESALANGAELAEVDLRDAVAVDGLVQRSRPEAIFHLGAQVDVRKSVGDPAFDSAVNVGGTVNVLSAANAHGVGRVVFASTGGAIYGEVQTIPATEDSPVAPEAPYGLSKFCAENYCALFNRLHGLSTVALRFGNVYGPRQDPLGEAGVIAIYCGLAVRGGRPVVFGDGLQTRDYVHVDDIVHANLLAAESDAGGSFNIGRGQEVTVLDLVEALAPHAPNGFEPDFQPERKGEVRRSALDATRARETFGWESRIDVAKGLEQTLGSLR